MEALRINDRLVIPAPLLAFTAVRASGAGGQNVNKVASKVELHFDLWACGELSGVVKARLAASCKHRFEADGRLRIVSQLTRDQGRNLDDAREKLAELIRAALTVPKPRRPTKPTRGSKVRRVDAKRHDSRKKQLRGRVRTDD
jgi:ribosome-associated protein